MARSHAEMADMLTHRGPFSDPRDGRVLRQIRLAFWSYAGLGDWKPKGTPPEVTTRYLVSFAYPRQYHSGQIRRWQVANTIKVASRVATATRARNRRGRPHPSSEQGF
jgi:hypothetical protein